MSLIKPVTCTVVDFDGVGLQHLYVTADCLRRGDGACTKFESFTNSRGGIERWFRCAEPPTFFEQVDARDYERICLTFSTALYFGRLQTPWVTIQTNVDPAEFERGYVKLQFGPGNGTYSVKTASMSPLPGAGRLEVQSPALATGCAKDMGPIKTEGRQAPESILCDTWQPLCSPIPEVPSLVSSPIRVPSAAPSELPVSPPELAAASTPDAGSGAISPLLLPSPRFTPVWSPRITRARARHFSLSASPGGSSSTLGRLTRSRKRKAAFADELEPPRKRRRFE